MEVIESIRTRRTLQSYRSDSIPQEVLDEILEAATWAPSHSNKQPWEFVLIGPETRRQLVPIQTKRMEEGPLKKPDMPEAKRQTLREFCKNFGNAPVMVAVLSQPPTSEMEIDEFPWAVAAAVQNMMLAAWSRGVASVWLSLGKYPGSRELLQVKDGYKVIAVVALGYPNASPPVPQRKPAGQKLSNLP